MSAAEGQRRCTTGVGVYVKHVSSCPSFRSLFSLARTRGTGGCRLYSILKAGVCHGGAQRMDKTALRAALGAWGIPTSGKLELLRQRLAAKIANPNE